MFGGALPTGVGGKTLTDKVRKQRKEIVWGFSLKSTSVNDCHRVFVTLRHLQVQIFSLRRLPWY